MCKQQRTIHEEAGDPAVHALYISTPSTAPTPSAHLKPSAVGRWLLDELGGVSGFSDAREVLILSGVPRSVLKLRMFDPFYFSERSGTLIFSPRREACRQVVAGHQPGATSIKMSAAESLPSMDAVIIEIEGYNPVTGRVFISDPLINETYTAMWSAGVINEKTARIVILSGAIDAYQCGHRSKSSSYLFALTDQRTIKMDGVRVGKSPTTLLRQDVGSASTPTHSAVIAASPAMPVLHSNVVIHSLHEPFEEGGEVESGPLW